MLEACASGVMRLQKNMLSRWGLKSREWVERVVLAQRSYYHYQGGVEDLDLSFYPQMCPYASGRIA